MLSDSVVPTLPSPFLVEEVDAGPAAGVDLRDLLTELSADWNSVRTIADRRLKSRTSCAWSASLTSLDVPAVEDEPPIAVRLTDVSRRGVGLLHADPLPYRLVQIVIESPDRSTPILVVRLQWCRFRKRGVYESGGQIQRVIGDRME